MKDVIQEANEKRFKADKDGDKRDAIKLSDAWLDELMKHPYLSRKFQHVTYVGKPGTGVYLLREFIGQQRDQKQTNGDSL